MKTRCSLFYCCLTLVILFSGVIPVQAVAADNDTDIAGKKEAASASYNTPEQAFIDRVAENVLKVIRSTESEQVVEDELEAVFEQHVALDWVAKFVLGRHWRTASEQQREQFLKYYREFIVRSYARRLQNYSGENYEVSEPTGLGKDRYKLTMKIYRPEGGQPILVDYKIREKSDSYKIYDIVVEGISLIATQRDEFDSVIDRNSLDALINALKRKARQG